MNSNRLHPRARKMLLPVLLWLIYGVIFTITIHAMRARQHGMDIPDALYSALPWLLTSLPSMIVGWLIGALFILLYFNRDVPKARTPTDAGRTRWHRLRLLFTIIVTPLLLLLAGSIVYHLAIGQWGRTDLLATVMWLFLAMLLFIFWKAEVSAENYYAIETGNTARANDERMHQINEKAGYATLRIFFLFLLFIEVPIEAITVGHWPVGTLTGIVVLFIIWTVALTYWNRRL